MIESFRDVGTEDVFNGRNTKAARQTCPRELWAVAARKLDQLDSVETIGELQIPPGNRLEALHGDREGQHSIRLSVTGSVFYGLSAARRMWKSSTITSAGELRRLVVIRVPTHRAPTHPGEMLLEEFLKPMGYSQQDLARRIQVPYQRINELVNRRRGVTPATALRLARFFGNSPSFWLNLQLRWDLYHAREAEAEALKKIRPLRVESSRS